MSKAFTKDDAPEAPPPAARTAKTRFTAKGLAHLMTRQLKGTDALLTRAFVEPPPEPFTGIARFGSAVTVHNDQGATITYVLVGPEEVPAWPKGPGLPVAVAIDSPIGAGLLGKRAGESAELELPRGPVELVLVRVDEE
ncbi:MAG: GreA/GreB family elongation factor [Myxococcaceae bacterium]